MKRFTSFLIALFAVVCSFSAAADDVNFKVDVPNPAAVKCTVNGVERELTQGLNDFSVPNYSPVAFESVAPHLLTKVTNKAGTPQNVYGGQWSLYVYPDSEGEVYTLVTINLDESRDSQCTITVDDPSRVNAALSGYNQPVMLKEGVNTVKFNSETESSLIVDNAVWDKPIYEIKLGDEIQYPNYYGSYEIPLTNNCEITITALVPDKDVTVTFTYSEQGEGAIKSVKVEGEEVADFDGKTLTMKAGQNLEVVPNTDFKIESMTMNGQETNWSGSYNWSTTVMNDTELAIDAHPYGTIHYTVKVDDPSNIVFYKGYSYRNDIINLVAGDNHLEISEGEPYVCWTAAEGCFIESALVDGEPLPYGNGTNMKEGTVVEFTTGKIVLDKTAVVWLSDTEVTTYYSLRCGDTNMNNIVSGYNVIPFWSGMVPFQLSFTLKEGVTMVNKVYLNDELLNPYYKTETYASYNDITPEDKSVLKVFIAESPVECNVTFNAPEGLEATVTYDRIKTLDKLADGLACFKGTEVAIEGPEDLTVKVGETELEKNDDNKFVFTVADPATTVTLADKSSGVESVVISTEADANAAVYNLMGVRVGTRADLNTLPAGIYVLNGQKVIVK